MKRFFLLFLLPVLLFGQTPIVQTVGDPGDTLRQGIIDVENLFIIRPIADTLSKAIPNALYTFEYKLYIGTADSCYIPAASKWEAGSKLADNGITYAKLDTSATGFIDVRKFGAIGDGVTDDTDAIQAALDYASANNTSGAGSNIVFIPAGKYLVSQITIKPQTSLIGVGPTSGITWLGGTLLVQKDGTNDNLIEIQNISGCKHWIKIANLHLRGNTVDTKGNGIRVTQSTGEGFRIERVNIVGFPGSGIKIDGGSVPCVINDAHLSSNDSSGIYFQMADLYETSAMTVFKHISGDNNGLSLIYLQGNPTHTTGGTFNLRDIKAETSTAGTQQNVIDIHDLQYCNIIIDGIHNSAIKSMNALIRIRNTTADGLYPPQVEWRNLFTDTDCAYYVEDLVTLDPDGGTRDVLTVPTSATYWKHTNGWGRNFSLSLQGGDDVFTMATESGYFLIKNDAPSQVTVFQVDSTGAATVSSATMDTLNAKKIKFPTAAAGLIRSHSTGFLLQTHSMTSGFTGGGLQLLGGTYANDADKGLIWAGATSDASAFTARSTTASGIYLNNGTINFYSNDGLTAGNTYTPTKRAILTAGGLWGINTENPQKRWTLSDGTDRFSLDVASDKLTFFNDAATPVAKASLDSAGTFAAVAADLDSATVGAGGIWQRDWYYNAADSSIRIVFYNSTLSRIDTVKCPQAN